MSWFGVVFMPWAEIHLLTKVNIFDKNKNKKIKYCEKVHTWNCDMSFSSTIFVWDVN